MAGSAARRARRANPVVVEEVDDGADVKEVAPARPRSRTAATRRVPPPAPAKPVVPAGRPQTERRPLLARLTGALDRRGDDPDQPTSSLRMRGSEVRYGYADAILLTIIPIVFLTVTTGKGAPAHPSSVAPAIGVVLALVMAASIRLFNRIVTAILAVSSSLATTATLVPTSIRFLSTLDLFAALAFSVWISLRQSKARNLAIVERRKATQSTRPARTRRGRNAPQDDEPAGPPRSARYTPPKKRP